VRFIELVIVMTQLMLRLSTVVQALRLVHPDKLSQTKGLTVEHKLLCRHIFIKLTDAYNNSI
jgi:hypothetical protein